MAETIAERAVQLTHGKEQEPNALDTLARVQFVLGKKPEAVATEEKAVNIASKPEEKTKLENTLASYQAWRAASREIGRHRSFHLNPQIPKQNRQFPPSFPVSSPIEKNCAIWILQSRAGEQRSSQQSTNPLIQHSDDPPASYQLGPIYTAPRPIGTWNSPINRTFCCRNHPIFALVYSFTYL